MKLRELGDDWREFERRLQELEREVWQSHWSHDDTIPERLSRAGMPQEQVDAFKRWRISALHTYFLPQLLFS
jgi:GMP synthase-like glutamine amidotransferase